MFCASPRSITAPAEPAALCALADEVEREFLVLGLGIVIEHFEPVDDGADRADQIVTDA
jgi:hypothetical protein